MIHRWVSSFLLLCSWRTLPKPHAAGRQADNHNGHAAQQWRRAAMTSVQGRPAKTGAVVDDGGGLPPAARTSSATWRMVGTSGVDKRRDRSGSESGWWRSGRGAATDGGCDRQTGTRWRRRAAGLLLGDEDDDWLLLLDGDDERWWTRMNDDDDGSPAASRRQLADDLAARVWGEALILCEF
jgi:hypothetical protein